MSTDIKRMENLIEQLNDATHAYDAGKPYMSDLEWDDLYFELLELEKKMGITYSNSPTQKINFQTVSALKKIEHNHPMLSLAKTKSLDEVKKFIGMKSFVAMCKMDGLTCSLRYYNGKLVSAETRGDGLIGEDILHNAMILPSIPKYISYKGELVVDGEIICCLDTFTNFFADTYKNARNFAAGSIRLLDSKECSSRHLTFVAWENIKGFEEVNDFHTRLELLTELGFIVVPSITIHNEKLDLAITFDTVVQFLKEKAQLMAYPIDGVVFKFNDIKYGQSLGSTEHHFRNAIAYKFYDEEYPTTLKNIEWTMGRTGVLTPIAIFDPIDIDGSTVSRASLHNISVMHALSGDFERIGDTLYIYKANQIIPQVSKWEHNGDYSKETHLSIPNVCPICGKPTSVKMDNDSKVLICTNPDCEGKLVNKFDHFCGKKGLDIKGLSKATLDKLIEWEWIVELSDIYKLHEHQEEWIAKPGFGEKSVANILNAIEASKQPTLQAFISSIGIPLIGKSMSKELIKHIKSYEEFRSLIDEQFDFSQFDGFASSKTDAILNFDYKQADNVYEIVKPLQIPEEVNSEKTLEGYTIVITGRLEKFKNRAELQAAIEAKGGKVAGSVSTNTDFLINNDNKSSSAKNLSAQKLNIPIITESEFTERFL